MPVGWDTGATGGGSTVAPILDAWQTAKDWLTPKDDIPEAVWEWTHTLIEWWEWVRRDVLELYEVPITGWATAGDERTCPECGPYDGATWEPDSWHIEPPLHVNCRCRTYLARVEVRARWVEAWQLAYRSRVEWEWEITRWE